jgi:membrane AbrB-like protein
MTRVLAVSLLLPFALASRQAGVQDAGPPFDILLFLLLLVVGFVVATFFKRASIPGGMLLGAFSSSAVLSATGMVSFSIPSPISAVACIVFATFIGGQFAGTHWRIFYQLALASAVTFIASFLISAVAALLAVILLHLPFSQALIAYAPGGLDVLILMSFLMKVDPAFVSTHHFVRLLVLILTLPAIGRWVGRLDKNETPVAPRLSVPVPIESERALKPFVLDASSDREPLLTPPEDALAGAHLPDRRRDPRYSFAHDVKRLRTTE